MIDNILLKSTIEKIKRLLDEEKYDEIVEISNIDVFKYMPSIQTLTIIALMRAKRYDEALEKTESFLAKNYNPEIEEKKVVLLQIIYGAKEALDECNKDINNNEELIQLRKAKILKELGRIDEALIICNRNGYANTDTSIGYRFIDLRKKLNNMKEEKVKTKKDSANNETKKYSANNVESILLTKIYVGKISKEEIENSDIDYWHKQILLLAYYEKVNKNEGLKIVKRLKTEFKDDQDKLHKLNNFYQKFNTKKIKLFDVELYENLLNSKVNFNLAMKLNTEEENTTTQEETKNEDTTIINVEHKKSKKNNKQKKMVGSIGISVNNRYNNVNNSNSTNIINTDSEEIDNTKSNSDILIKDYFRNESEAIKKYLYAAMADESSRKSATNAYDLFEILISKNINDIAALKRFKSLLEKMTSVLRIDTKVSEDKFKKVLK